MTRKYTHFGGNLKLLRKRENLNQAQLAENLKIERTTISNYENNISEPPLRIVVQIAHIFHTSLDALLTRDLRQEILQSDAQRNQDVESQQVRAKKYEQEIQRLQETNLHFKEKIELLEDYLATLKKLLPDREIKDITPKNS